MWGVATRYAVRPLRGADLKHVASIEASGGQQYQDLFGAELHPCLLAPPDSGWDRDAKNGVMLVAADGLHPPVGFAHLLEIDDHAHLEQLSVRPEAQRQGIGTALVHAAMREAWHLGHRNLSLCTYREVPFNGPFYSRLGFEEVVDLLPYQRLLREHERAIGLDVNGPRIVMSAALGRKLPTSQLTSGP